MFYTFSKQNKKGIFTISYFKLRMTLNGACEVVRQEKLPAGTDCEWLQGAGK